MPRSYVTLSPDLVEYADAAADYLKGAGLRVAVEPPSLHFPNTPTMTGTRHSTQYIVEVAPVAEPTKFIDWVHYGRAREKETFIVLVLPGGTNVSMDDLAKLRTLGVGVFTSTTAGLTTLIDAVDVSTTVGLPDLSHEKRALRLLLNPPFQRISGGAVIDGFKDAATVFEGAARDHLKQGVLSTRIRFVTAGGNPRTATGRQISKLTLGQLGGLYGEITAPTQADDLVRRAIESILKDRNDAVHNCNTPAIVRRIKKNVRQHVYAIVNAMREII